MNEKVKKALDLLEYLRKATLDTDIDEMGGLVLTDESCFENEINELKDIVNDFDRYHESQQDLIKSKDEYIAKLCNDRAELKEQLKQVEDFKYHYDRYKKELANNLKTINCMQEEATTNYNLINSLEDRNDRLVERLEKQKAELNELREFVKIISSHTNINRLTLIEENELEEEIEVEENGK